MTHEFWAFDTLSPERCALVVPGGADVTYGALSDAADGWRAKLERLALGRRCVVAVELDMAPGSIAAYLGALRAGFPVLVLEPRQFADDSRIERVWKPEIHVPVGATEPVLLNAPDSEVPEPHPDLRVLLSTSGSTGDPKLVRLSGRNVGSNATAIAEYLGIVPGDRAALTLPLHYSYGMSVLNSYLAAGASLVLTRHSVTEDAFWTEARAAGVTSLALVPHQFDLLTHGGFDGTELPTLRYVTQAGGKLDPGSIGRFAAMAKAAGWQLFVMYGQTEAAPRISYVPPEALPEAASTIGKAIPGGRIWIADEDGAEITAPDRPGELVYEGPNVMMGYAEVRADLARGHGTRELRTGDIAERTPEGFFRITGRLKRFVKLFGLRLSLDRIEALLREKGIPAQAVALDDRLVILHADPDRGAEARAAVAAEYDLPETVIHTGHLAELPLLSSGKPDQKAIRALAETALTRALEREARMSAQRGISEMVGRITRNPHVGPDDSFISLGGDSLSYIQVQMLLETRLASVPEGWENMPLSKLEALPRAASGAEAPTPQVRVGVDVLLRLMAITLVMAQHASDYPLYGGTWMLIAIMGYSVARFQIRQIAEGQALTFVLRMLYPIIPLYFLLMIPYALLRDEVPLHFWALVANYHDRIPQSLLNVYWFVSLYAQIILLLAAVIAIRPLREAVVAAPWRAAAATSVALLAGLAALALFGPRDETGIVTLPYFPERGLPECLSVFVLGWMLRTMQGRAQVVATLALSAATVLLWIGIYMPLPVAGFLGFALAMLAVAPSVFVSRGLGHWINRLATVTLFVYLLHMIVLHVFRSGLSLSLSQPVLIVLTVIGSFALSLLVKHWFDVVDDWLMRLRPRVGRLRVRQPSNG